MHSDCEVGLESARMSGFYHANKLILLSLEIESSHSVVKFLLLLEKAWKYLIQGCHGFNYILGKCLSYSWWSNQHGWFDCLIEWIVRYGVKELNCNKYFNELNIKINEILYSPWQLLEAPSQVHAHVPKAFWSVEGIAYEI